MRDNFAGNVSPSTGQSYSERFDYEPGDRTPNPHDTARKSVYDMPDAEYDVLMFWINHALVPEACRVGRSYDAADTGGSYTDDLLELTRTDTTLGSLTRDEFKGALLISGRSFYPTFRTTRSQNWRVPCRYVGIPYSSPIRAEFDNLVGAL